MGRCKMTDILSYLGFEDNAIIFKRLMDLNKENLNFMNEAEYIYNKISIKVVRDNVTYIFSEDELKSSNLNLKATDIIYINDMLFSNVQLNHFVMSNAVRISKFTFPESKSSFRI